MHMQTVTFVRGLPGSGKSTFATMLAASIPGALAVAADDWFDANMAGGFDPAKLRDAHAWCQQTADAYLRDGGTHLFIHNTGTQKWEIKPYADMAANYGARFTVVHVEGNFGSVHNVPPEALAKMAARWEPWT